MKSAHDNYAWVQVATYILYSSPPKIQYNTTNISTSIQGQFHRSSSWVSRLLNQYQSSKFSCIVFGVQVWVEKYVETILKIFCVSGVASKTWPGWSVGNWFGGDDYKITDGLWNRLSLQVALESRCKCWSTALVHIQVLFIGLTNAFFSLSLPWVTSHDLCVTSAQATLPPEACDILMSIIPLSSLLPIQVVNHHTHHICPSIKLPSSSPWVHVKGNFWPRSQVYMIL